jgi:hypothetical protein
MSTRGVYTFIDKNERFHVYKHWDNYPEHPQGNEDINAYAWIRQAKARAWDLPRFEASEFAAGFVATHKNDGGGVYLTKHYNRHADIDYRYEVRAVGDKLEVRAFNMYDKTDKIKKVYL